MKIFTQFFIFLFIKYFFKKLILGIFLFMLAYFGLDDLKILRSAIGQQDYEFTQQVDIENFNSEMGSQRRLRYRLSNTGINPLLITVNAQSKDDIIEYKVGSTFKIYSVTADPRNITVKPSRPYQNYLTLEVKEIPAGLGLDIYFLENEKSYSYFNELSIETDTTTEHGVYIHDKNISPIKIMLMRFSKLFLICLSTSAISVMFFGVIINAIRDHSDITV